MGATTAVLVVEKGAEDASIIALDAGEHIVGKLPYADISFQNPYVSRRHAEIRVSGERCQVRDLDSKNGTYLNGERLTGEPRWLGNGDCIQLGLDKVMLRFHASTTTLTLSIATEAAREQGIKVDSRAREVWLQGIKLTPPLARKEFAVLELLYARRGEACSKDDIASHAWPERSEGDVGDQEIEQCIRRLRLRVEPDPSRPQYIVNIRGYGYRLNPE